MNKTNAEAQKGSSEVQISIKKSCSSLKSSCGEMPAEEEGWVPNREVLHHGSVPLILMKEKPC